MQKPYRITELKTEKDMQLLDNLLVLLFGNTVEQEWIIPTLLNSWVNYSAGDWDNVGYMKDKSGFVHLRGLLKSGADTIMFVLPEGYRPWRNMMFCVTSSGEAIRVEIYSNGNVYWTGAIGSYNSLAGIIFRAIK